MRRLVSLSLLAAAAAAADESVPDAARDPIEVAEVPAAGALAYRLQYDVRREHGCSQSFESEGEAGSVTLTVAADGAARLVVDGDQSYTFGPSLGRYRAGDHDFDHRYSKTHGEWSGVARRAGRSLTVELRPAGQPEGAPAALRLECRVGRVDVEPDAPGGARTERGALLCSPGKALSAALGEVTTDGALPFGRRAGYRAERSRRGFGDDAAIRRAR
jgi:hypothetical protein